MAGYRARTGVTTLIVLTKHLCKLYGVYSSKIIAYITASSLPPDQKAAILTWLSGASAACAALLLIGDD